MSTLKETILNIPTVPTSASQQLMEKGQLDDIDDETIEEEDDATGEPDDGKTGKLTLSMLLQEGLITPGEGVMSIDYLGQTFKGDLLNTGKIQSQETGMIFNNPSAWAIYCKQIVNPAKKSGCGWASVKYKGRKMDYFKTLWYKVKAQREKPTGHSNKDNEETEKQETENKDKGSSLSKDTFDDFIVPIAKPAILKHCRLPPKHPVDNLTTLIDVETFQDQGKIQPFNVSISSSALLIIDLHSHLNLECVCGYLAGQWDLNSHNLAITHAFPCLTDLKDQTSAVQTETRIYNEIYEKNLTLVGWYRSCPGLRALPSLKDTEAQLEHQMKLIGPNDASYTPCVGMIVSPYSSFSSEAEVLIYWVAPPPDSGPMEYGKPLKMLYTVVTDPCLSQEVLTAIEDMISFYKEHPRKVSFKRQLNKDVKYITKMGRSLLPKFPRDQDERLWKYIRILILGKEDQEIEDPLMIKPPVAVEEDEIDDDEDNAINQRINKDGSNLQTSKNLNIVASATPSTTEQVISLLLQQQLAPPAHQSTTVTSSYSGSAPLDFSKH